MKTDNASESRLTQLEDRSEFIMRHIGPRDEDVAETARPEASPPPKPKRTVAVTPASLA